MSTLPLGQNVICKRIKQESDLVVRKSGIVTPTGQLQDEGLATGIILYVSEDQNMLIDKERAISDIKLKKGDKVWYSVYSVGKILNDAYNSETDTDEEQMLDVVPLEDLRAVVV